MYNVTKYSLWFIITTLVIGFIVIANTNAIHYVYVRNLNSVVVTDYPLLLEIVTIFLYVILGVSNLVLLAALSVIDFYLGTKIVRLIKSKDLART